MHGHTKDTAATVETPGLRFVDQRGFLWMLVRLRSAQQSGEKLQRRNICMSSICADVKSTDTY